MTDPPSFRFDDGVQPCQAGSVGEQRGGQGAAGDGDLGAGMGDDELCQNTAGKHGIADAVRGNE